MRPILLKFGPVTIYSFGVALFFAVVLAAFLIWKQARKRGLSEEKVFDCFLLTIFIGLIGARLGYVFSNWSLFSVDFSRIILVGHYPGFSFLWGIISGILGVLVVASSTGLEAFLVADFFTIAFSWSLLFGLGGCYLDGCLINHNQSLITLSIISGLLALILVFAKRKISSRADLATLARRHGLYFSAYLIFLSLSLLIIPGVSRPGDKNYFLAVLIISIILFMVKFPASVLSEIRKHLEKKHVEVESRLKDLKKEDPFEDKARLLDRASEDSEVQSKANHERVAAMQQQLNMAQVQIRKALTKIKIGKYGICESCGKMIDTDRLAAIPTAVLCLSCEKKREK